MAFGFLRNFFPSRSFVGVDIGTTSIKLIELEKSKGLPELINYAFLESYGHLERLNDAIQTSTLKMLDKQTIELLKILLRASGVRSKNAVASIPAFSSFTSLIELPVMSDEETVKAMRFQAKQYIPLPVSAVTLDWLRVGERKDEKGNVSQQVLLVAVPNEQIEKYKNIFKGAGLDLIALEVEGLSTARSLTGGNDQATLIVDIGSRSSTISIAKNGLMKFSGQTDFAGSSLTQTIASGLNIKMRKAEDLKKQRGLKGTGGEYELSTLMLPILDVIISEAKRIKENYEKGYGEKIERVVLSGGGSNLLGAVTYFQEQFGLPTSKANPFSRLKYDSEIESLTSELGPGFSVAIGLAIRGFAE
jgi:type IV pilus assembly protein PilM